MLTINEILDLIKNGKINESNLDSKDLIRIQFYTQKLNEEVYKNYITAYHRTIDINEFLDKSNEHGFQLGGGAGAMYGVGLYGNYTWEAVHTKFSIRTYGDYVVKYIVKPNNVLFFDEKTQVKIYGKPMSLIEQCDYWGINLTDKQRKGISHYNNRDVTITSNTAKLFIDEILFVNGVDKARLIPDIFGISYNGNNDKDTILMYDFRNISIVGWYDETKGISSQKDMIPLNKTHNYYNPVNVSKEVLKNTAKTQSNTINKDDFISINGKLIPKDMFNYENIQSMNKKYKRNLYLTLAKNLSESERLNYFVRLFFINDYKYIIQKDNEISLKPVFEGDDFNIRDFPLDFIPFKIQDIPKVNIIIKDSDIKDLRNIPTNIYTKLELINLNKLVSLKGLENLTFFAEDIELHRVHLIDLPKITNLDYLPDNIPMMYISDCKKIDFNSVKFPSGIMSLNFINYDIPNNRFDLSRLDELSNLKSVMLNGISLKRLNNHWIFP